MTRHVHRDAVTGRIVTAEYAAGHPDTTVGETMPETAEYDALTESVRLRERLALAHAAHSHTCGILRRTYTALSTAEQERDRLREERDAAQEHVAYHLRDFRPGVDDKSTGDLAVDMAAYAGRLKLRAEAAEQDRNLLREEHSSCPTTWAYEQACRTIEKHRARADRLREGIQELIDTWTQEAGDLVPPLHPAAAWDLAQDNIAALMALAGSGEQPGDGRVSPHSILGINPDATGPQSSAEYVREGRDRPAPVVPDELAERCMAHGRTVAEHHGTDCARPSPRCQCSVFEGSGLHWDTCPGREREPLPAPVVPDSTGLRGQVKRAIRREPAWQATAAFGVPIEAHEHALDLITNAVLAAVGQGVTAEQAWDEGYRRACGDHSTWCRRTDGDHGQRHINPYRARPVEQDAPAGESDPCAHHGCSARKCGTCHTCGRPVPAADVTDGGEGA